MNENNRNRRLNKKEKIINPLILTLRQILNLINKTSGMNTKVI